MPGMFCDRCKSIMTPVGDRLVCRSCGMTRSRDGGAGSSNDRGQSSKPRFQTRLAGTKEEKPVEVQEESAPPPNPDPSSIFPYLPRPHQMDFVDLIGEVLESRGNLVVESGTGTGKTVCALAGTVEHALANDKRVVYITRTNSQATIAIKELRAISKRRNVLGISLQGRRNSCPMLSELSVDNLTPGELSRVCEHKKKNTRDGTKGGCTYYANTVHLGQSYFRRYCADNIPTSDELSRFCEADGACPYEVGKMLMPEAKVVIAPYPYIISGEVRHHFLEQLQAEADDLILVVDEAHNLADAARDAESIRITKKIVSIVTVEAGEMGNAKLSKDVDLKKLAGALFGVLDRAAELCAESGKDEVALGRGFLEGTLCESLGCDRGELAEIVAEMQATGEEMAQRRLQGGKEPTSATFTLGRDLTNWVASDNARFVRRATMEEGGMIEAYCLDPKGALSFFHEVYGSIHMSGTLRPLDQYVRVTGLGREHQDRDIRFPVPEGKSPGALRGRCRGQVRITVRSQCRAEAARLRLRSGQCRSPQHNDILPFPCHAAQLPLPQREAALEEGLPRGAGRVTGKAGGGHRAVQARFPEGRRVLRRNGREGLRGTGLSVRRASVGGHRRHTLSQALVVPRTPARVL